MTFDDVLTVAGSAGGVALLAVMAMVPLLLDLPTRPVAFPEVTIPQQRGPVLSPCSSPAH